MEESGPIIMYALPHAQAHAHALTFLEAGGWRPIILLLDVF